MFSPAITTSKGRPICGQRLSHWKPQDAAALQDKRDVGGYIGLYRLQLGRTAITTLFVLATKPYRRTKPQLAEDASCHAILLQLPCAHS